MLPHMLVLLALFVPFFLLITVSLKLRFGSCRFYDLANSAGLAVAGRADAFPS